MKWINNYAWFGRKGASYVSPFILGIVAEQKVPDLAIWLFIFVMAIFGWSRSTRAANDVWFNGNRGPVEDED
ncbi:hypothetical protein [Escherichia coli]|uniref:hypothetical protein n=1 Tax=Escherichia coli TaxID=562 RepID=UPI00374D0CFE